MAENTAAGDDFQKQLMDLFERGQEAIVEAVQQWTETGAKLMPDLPSVPVDDLFPSAEKAVADQFEFAEELLAAQRRFAEELLATLRPPAKKD